MKHIDQKIIKLFVDFLFSNNIISSIKDYSYLFSDEPRFFQFNSLINEKNPLFESKGFFVDLDNVTSSGISSVSRELALFKCLAEALERFCQHCYQEEFIYVSKFSDLKKPALIPLIFRPEIDIKKVKFSWVKGKNLSTKKDLLIPTQLVYLNYFKNSKISEPILGQLNSSGTAGGFTDEEAILLAIFELIERDAFMGIYLSKIKTSRLDLTNIKDEEIKNILTELEKKYFKPYVFEITTDLGIPVFLAIIVDIRGEKPYFTIGAKCNLDQIKAVKGALEEAVMPRVWLRSEMLKNQSSKKVVPREIDTFLKRATFWNSNKSMLSNLDFLLKQNPIKKILKKTKTNENDLTKVIEIFLKKGYQIYDKDISFPGMKKISFHVHRVIIPDLQPLYLDEQYKEINIARLKKISRYYNQPIRQLNTIPHPFL